MLTGNYLKYSIKKYLRDCFAKESLVKNINANDKLVETLKRAVSEYNFYKDIDLNIKSESIETELLKFPVIRKNDLLVNKENFYPKKKLWFATGKTSGTTGTPLEIFRSYKSVLMETSFIRRHWKQCGFKMGMRRATLRGDIVVPFDREKPPFWFFNKFDNQLIISSRHLRDSCFKIITDKLEEFSPYIIEAYPSAAYELANFLRKNNRKIKIPYIFTGSEMLYSHQRKLIEEQFSGKVLDFYGMAERVALVTECMHGNLHINSDYSYVEILDKNGNRTDDYGFITGTTYHNNAMPLIRYQLNDVTKWKKGKCTCGSFFPMIEPVQGKYEDSLYDYNGNRISPSVLTFAFKGLKNVRKSQVVQISKDTWEVRIVLYNKYNKFDQNDIKNNIKKYVSDNIKIETVLLNEIPATSAGKYQWVKNEFYR